MSTLAARRLEKINHAIRQRVSELLQREVKDPRLSRFISVTRVVTTPDLRHSRIYVSMMGPEEERQETFKCLTDAQGYFRHELADALKLRYTPEVTFCVDTSIEEGAHVLELMKTIESESRSASAEAAND